MTRYLLDVASYQGALSPATVKAAGFTTVNLKISHGLGQKSVHPSLAMWVSQARSLGLGISTFHYFTADAPGVDQARYAHGRMVAHGITAGTAHQLDVESSPAPTLANVRAYLTEMTRLLGRPVALYTGDWWWQPKGWNVADLTPYAWSAPNAGYLKSYPGDMSSHWTAGWGGWPALSVMQYSVSPMPIGEKIDVSMSAIRDEKVWTALTTTPAAPTSKGAAVSTWVLIDCLIALRNEFNSLNPNRDKGADGSIGDSAHTSSSDHTPDEDSDVLRDHDADSKNEVHAIDIDSTGPWPKPFGTIISELVAREKAEYESADIVGRLQNVIYNRRIASRSWGWTWRDYTGTDPHTNHAHISGRYTTAQENDTRSWGVEEDESMSAADVAALKTELALTKAAIIAEVNQVAAEVHTRPIGNKAYETRNMDHILNDAAAEQDDWYGDALGAATRPPKAGSLGALVKALAVADVPGRLDRLEKAIADLAAAVKPPAA